MFDISPRDRYLYAGPCGYATTAMTYGRMANRREPSHLMAKRHVVTPWDDNAMLPDPDREPREVRELRRTLTAPPRMSPAMQRMLAARDARRK